MSEPRRRWRVPEVVQTSDMDCGPAVLQCLLAGHGVRASYERLRELCNTDVDGTSIDRLERAMVGLGLRAKQVLVPERHVFEADSRSLPALAVIRRADGFPHFLALWRRVGPWVMVMDPAVGRRWMSVRTLTARLLRHEMPLPALAWRPYAGTEEFTGCLRHRMHALGVGGLGKVLLEEAVADPGYRSLAALEAAVNTLDSLMRARAVSPGAAATRLLRSLYEHGRKTAPGDPGPLPRSAWSVRPIAGASDQSTVLMVRGAVLVRVRGLAAATERDAGRAHALRQAIAPRGAGYGRLLWRLVRAGGLASLAALAIGMVAAGLAVVVEALLLRGLLDAGLGLGRHEQRLAVVATVGSFLALLLLLEWPLRAVVLEIGRQLELRLRLWVRQCLPHLPDRYYSSRLVSDMAARSHQVADIRDLPEALEVALRASCELLVTALGIVWLDPVAGPGVLLTVTLVVGLPLLVHPWLAGADLRVRTHAGALGRFYLDGFLGLLPIRAHGAETAMMTEHESKLVAWMSAGLRLHGLAVATDALRKLLVVSLSIWLVVDHVQRSPLGVPMLLVVYWTLKLPSLGEAIGSALNEAPRLQNTTRRLLEPLHVEVESTEDPPTASEPGVARGVAVELRSVSLVRGGHETLEGVHLALEPGEHVAVVGPSGAGKSSLVGLLLGWYRPSAGNLLVDGQPLEGATLAALRRRSAWVDPAVRLWNKSLLANLLYASDGRAPSFDDVLEDAGLWPVIGQLPEGMQTPLGEGGGLVSGGEGQRVRFARALAQTEVSLAILDEPFRGLDRERRLAMLAAARRRWRHATLLFVTHDLGAALDFDRVLVIENGRLVEQGPPRRLAEEPGSAFHRLLERFAGTQRELWGDESWRRLWLEHGRLAERRGEP